MREGSRYRAGWYARAAAVIAAIAWSLALLPAAGCSDEGAGRAVELTVAAASDLTGVTDELAVAFREQTGTRVVFDVGSSGQLAQQIAAGAPVDVFLAADRGYVQELVDRGLVAAEDMLPYATGILVAWSPEGAETPFDDLTDLVDPGVTRIAIANPSHAPYGRAAREALEAAGVWTDTEPKLVMGENVLQALQFAESGNAQVALVAASVARDAGGRVWPVPEHLYDPLRQTLGVLARSEHLPEARAFAEFMRGPEAQAILARNGFAPPGP